MRTGGRLGLGMVVAMEAVPAVGGWAGYFSRCWRSEVLGWPVTATEYSMTVQYKGNNQDTRNTDVMPMMRVRGKPMRTKSMKP